MPKWNFIHASRGNMWLVRDETATDSGLDRSKSFLHRTSRVWTTMPCEFVCQTLLISTTMHSIHILRKTKRSWNQWQNYATSDAPKSNARLAWKHVCIAVKIWKGLSGICKCLAARPFKSIMVDASTEDSHFVIRYASMVSMKKCMA